MLKVLRFKTVWSFYSHNFSLSKLRFSLEILVYQIQNFYIVVSNRTSVNFMSPFNPWPVRPGIKENTTFNVLIGNLKNRIITRYKCLLLDFIQIANVTNIWNSKITLNIIKNMEVRNNHIYYETPCISLLSDFLKWRSIDS